MIADIQIEGLHAQIINDLNSQNVLTGNRGNADLFFLAVLIGLYHSKQSEMELLNIESLNISRTFLAKDRRSEFKYLLNTFENLESKFNGVELSISQIFLDEEGTNNSDKMISIKKHGYAGLEYLHKKYLEDTMIYDKVDVIKEISKDLLEVEELEKLELDVKPVINSIDDLLERDD